MSELLHVCQARYRVTVFVGIDSVFLHHVRTQRVKQDLVRHLRRRKLKVPRCADGWNDDYVIAELLLLQFRPHPTADLTAMYQPALEFQPHPVSEPRTEIL